MRSPTKTDFNPHTREGCDPDEVVVPLLRGEISIHTPARGVTGRQIWYYEDGQKFQSTHPRGV